MADEGIFLDEEHPRSGRSAVFEVNHYSAWLYLSEPGSHKPAKSALAFSTGHLADLEEAIKVANAGGRPPLSNEYACEENGVIENPHPDEFFFWWSEDGQSVALMRLGQPLAMITAKSNCGHTKAVTAKGFYGDPWHQDHYEKLFGREIF